jgi:ParB/RepB/Spo0J family partition protein
VSTFDSPAESLPGPRMQKSKPVFETVEGGQSAPSSREGLPPGYRMRADPHYVDLLASRSSKGRERILAVQSIDAPLLADPAAVAPLIESIKRDGVLQPLLVQERDGAFRLISGRKRLSAAVAAGLRDVPCLLFDVDDAEAARLADAADITTRAAPAPERSELNDASLHAGNDLARSLATLGACADLLSGSQSELSRAVAANLIRAEVWRASCLLHATRIVRGELSVARGAISVLGILDRVEQGFLPERQVRAIRLDSRSTVPHGSFVAADEKMLIGAVSCAVLATLATLDGMKDARLTIAAALEPIGHATFSVTQDAVTVPDVWFRRAFDHEWVERPGGLPATVSMLAVRAAAEAHGGAAAVGVATRGTRIAITIPTGL